MSASTANGTPTSRIVGAVNRRKSKDAYAELLIALFKAQQASDRAKSRAANGETLDSFCAYSNSYYAEANYRRSREARDLDYTVKWVYLRMAASLRTGASIKCGFKESDSRIPYVLYFELPTGQVSFHSDAAFDLPEYDGEWDGSHDSRLRIAEAIHEYYSATRGKKR